MEVSIHLNAEHTPTANAHETADGGFIIVEFGHEVCLYLPGYGLDCVKVAIQLADELTRAATEIVGKLRDDLQASEVSRS